MMFNFLLDPVLVGIRDDDAQYSFRLANSHDPVVVPDFVNSTQCINGGGREKLQFLHERCGHISFSTLKNAIRHDLMLNSSEYKSLLKINDIGLCKVCAMAKQVAKPHFPSITEHIDKIGTHFSTDACGPFPVRSIGGKRYFISLLIEKLAAVSFILWPRRVMHQIF